MFCEILLNWDLFPINSRFDPCKLTPLGAVCPVIIVHLRYNKQGLLRMGNGIKASLVGRDEEQLNDLVFRRLRYASSNCHVPIRQS